jgi:hypothetical protein
VPHADGETAQSLARTVGTALGAAADPRRPV